MWHIHERMKAQAHRSKELSLEHSRKHNGRGGEAGVSGSSQPGLELM